MSFKTFDLSSDVASIVSAINEVVALSSSLFAQDANVKYYTNIASASSAAQLGGYFQTVYDSVPTSATSTPLFDVTYGYATSSLYNTPASAYSSQNEKTKIYRMMASSLLGNANSVFTINSQAATECFFVSIKRGIQKDEIKKGSTSLVILGNGGTLTASDAGAESQFKQTVGGDFGVLKNVANQEELGQIWYNSGIIVLKAANASYSGSWATSTAWSGSATLVNCQSGSTINSLADGLRKHLTRIDFHNQTNLYSTIYFCRATNSEFNYSSNPTFVDSTKRIVVTSGSNILQTRTYVTTVGLYDANDNLLAVAKLNKPITKAPDSEATFRVRLDY